jgi:hypothetical protein
MTEPAQGFLGIMTGRRQGHPPIAEPEFCSQLSAAAPLFDLKVLVFHPEDVAENGDSITGYAWKEGRWQQTVAPAPDILYNRCLYSSRQEKKAAAAALAALSRTVPWSRDCLTNGESMKYSAAARLLHRCCRRPDSIPVRTRLASCLPSGNTAYF